MELIFLSFHLAVVPETRGVVGHNDGCRWNLDFAGNNVASATGAFGAILINDANWAIGAPGASDSRFFTGDIGNVTIYDHALSAAQARERYPVAKKRPAAH